MTFKLDPKLACSLLEKGINPSPSIITTEDAVVDFLAGLFNGTETSNSLLLEGKIYYSLSGDEGDFCMNSFDPEGLIFSSADRSDSAQRAVLMQEVINQDLSNSRFAIFNSPRKITIFRDNLVVNPKATKFPQIHIEHYNSSHVLPAYSPEKNPGIVWNYFSTVFNFMRSLSTLKREWKKGEDYLAAKTYIGLNEKDSHQIEVRTNISPVKTFCSFKTLRISKPNSRLVLDHLMSVYEQGEIDGVEVTDKPGELPTFSFKSPYSAYQFFNAYGKRLKE